MYKSKPRAYLHTDVETMTLKAHRGLVWAIGIHVTDGNLVPMMEREFKVMAHPDLWDTDTLNWATKTYGESFLGDIMRGEQVLMAVDIPIAACLQSVVRDMERLGYECWMVANHTHFDVTHLLALHDRIDWVFPIKYNHVLDMPSLMVGHNAATNPFDTKTPSQLLYAVGKSKEATAHHALADARDQADTLRRLNITLPQ